jgi:hypothetical protein
MPLRLYVFIVSIDDFIEWTRRRLDLVETIVYLALVNLLVVLVEFDLVVDAKLHKSFNLLKYLVVQLGNIKENAIFVLGIHGIVTSKYLEDLFVFSMREIVDLVP